MSKIKQWATCSTWRIEAKYRSYRTSIDPMPIPVLVSIVSVFRLVHSSLMRADWSTEDLRQSTLPWWHRFSNNHTLDAYINHRDNVHVRMRSRWLQWSKVTATRRLMLKILCFCSLTSAETQTTSTFHWISHFVSVSVKYKTYSLIFGCLNTLTRNMFLPANGSYWKQSPFLFTVPGYDPPSTIILLISLSSINDCHYHINERCSWNGSPSWLVELVQPSGFAAPVSVMSKTV